MYRVGTDEAGFQLGSDRQAHLLRARLWGFWDEPLAAEFKRRIADELARLSWPWYLVWNCEALSPLRPVVQNALREVIAQVCAQGMRRGALVTQNALAKLPLIRLVKESRARDGASWEFFYTDGAALSWLRHPVEQRSGCEEDEGRSERRGERRADNRSDHRNDK